MVCLLLGILQRHVAMLSKAGASGYDRHSFLFPLRWDLRLGIQNQGAADDQLQLGAVPIA